VKPVPLAELLQLLPFLGGTGPHAEALVPPLPALPLVPAEGPPADVPAEPLEPPPPLLPSGDLVDPAHAASKAQTLKVASATEVILES
jgi:hypothetical protein